MEQRKGALRWERPLIGVAYFTKALEKFIRI